jgi:hypothetical protein
MEHPLRQYCSLCRSFPFGLRYRSPAMAFDTSGRTDSSERYCPLRPSAAPSSALRGQRWWTGGAGSTAFAGIVLAVVAAGVQAQGFSASVSPPRVELQAQPGQTVRQVLDIQQASVQPGRFRLYTNDWTYGADNAVSFANELAPGSCRPWVALERRELTVPGNGRHRFRLEVTVPADAPAGECRFAVMVEGLDTYTAQAGAISLPVTGRIGVIFYVAVGDAKAHLSVAAQRVPASVNAAPPLALEVRNSGNATGRLDGVISGTDAAGQRLDFAPANGPILPGQTRAIALTALAEPGKPAPTWRLPLTLRGTLEAGAQRLPVELTFAP